MHGRERSFKKLEYAVSRVEREGMIGEGAGILR